MTTHQAATHAGAVRASPRLRAGTHELVTPHRP
jgi:hypothetical protein